MIRFALALLACVLAAGAARAQTGAPTQCGPTTVNSGAASAVVFPVSGGHGPGYPTIYLSISNASSTATLWVNPFGGNAAANTSGSFPILPGASPLTWSAPGYPPPSKLTVISSADGTPMTCAYQ